MSLSPIRRLADASIALGGFIFACVSHLPAADISSTGKHCLWRITNAPAPFYLLGSVHALQPSDYRRTPVIEEAISQAQQFLFEFDPKEDETLWKKLREAARYPRDQQILGKIGPKTYKYLQKITISGMNDWQHLHPWAIAMILRNPGFGPASTRYGIDNYVAQKARYHSSPTGGLETVDEHIHVFSDMHEIEGEVFLLQCLVHCDEDPKQFQDEVAAWKSGNTERLYALQLPRIREAPTIWWRLLDRRNARWIPKIEAAISQENQPWWSPEPCISAVHTA